MSTISTKRDGLTWTFTVAGVGKLTLDVSKLDDTMRVDAMMDRFLAKVVDTAAIPRDPITGQSATPQSKFNAMRDMIDQLNGGEWTIGSAIYTAIAETRKIERSAARAIFDGLSEEQKKAIRNSPSIRGWYAARRKPADATVGENLLATLFPSLGDSAEQETDETESVETE